MYAEENNCGLF